jgi:hypothetical protein
MGARSYQRSALSGQLFRKLPWGFDEVRRNVRMACSGEGMLTVTIRELRAES